MRPLDQRDISPDEVMYSTYANVIAHEGLKGTAIAVDTYSKNSKLWTLPPPTRVGYVYPLAALMKYLDRSDYDVGVYLSRVCSILSLGVLVLIGFRFFGARAAVSSLLFLALSSYELVLARRTWQDGLMTLWSGVLIWVVCELLRKPKAIVLWLAYFLIVCYGPLIKESAVLVLGLMGICCVSALVIQKKYVSAAIFIGVSTISLGISFFVLAYLAGGITPLLSLYGLLKSAVAQNQYAGEFQNGAYFSLFYGLFTLSPVALSFFLVGIFFIIFRAFSKGNSKYFNQIDGFIPIILVVFIVSFFLIASFPSYFKNLRYISPIYIPFYLLAGFGADFLVKLVTEKFKGVGRTPATLVIAAILCGGLIYEYKTYEYLFIQKKVKDLSPDLIKEFLV